jgi:aldose 1-epimerase
MRPGEVAIENDRLRLTVLPDFGAAVTAFTLKRDGGEVDIFRPWDGTPDNPSRLASINLIPWSNRISGGGITVGSRFYPLKPNREGEPYPIHGDGFQQAWRVVETRPDLIHLAIESAVQAPYDYRAHVVYGLSPTALTMRMEVEHQGDEPAPYGMGFHPWFPRTPGVTLEAPARTVWLETEDHLPAGAVPVAERPEWDFGTAKPLPPTPVNNGFTGWQGQARIAWPERGLAVEIKAEPEFSTYMLYSPAQDCGFFCFEPVSHPVDAFHLPGGPQANGLRLLSRFERFDVAAELTVLG